MGLKTVELRKMREYKIYYCHVCGLEQEEAPWGEDGNTPSFDLCMCCGIQFGYEDIVYEVIERYRENWIENGAEWFQPKFKPQEWDLNEQLKNAWQK